MNNHVSLQGGLPGDVPAFAIASNLWQRNLGASEWYLYAYLQGLSWVQGCNPFTTTMTALRRGNAKQQPVNMTLNTIKSALASLEDEELIVVDRTRQGQSLLLSITLV